MVTEAIYGAIFSFVNFLFKDFATIRLGDVDLSALDPIMEYVNMASYLIPFKELLPLFYLFVVLMNFRISVRLVKTMWEIIPLL